jgi:hypothetical protein
VNTKEREKKGEKEKYRTIEQEFRIVLAFRFDLVEKRKSERQRRMRIYCIFFSLFLFVSIMLVARADREKKSNNYFSHSPTIPEDRKASIFLLNISY